MVKKDNSESDSAVLSNLTLRNSFLKSLDKSAILPVWLGHSLQYKPQYAIISLPSAI